MAMLGIVLSSEERSAPELVHEARTAEQAGFAHGWVSDHFHRVTTTAPRLPRRMPAGQGVKRRAVHTDPGLFPARAGTRAHE
jgi:alkanesulfonate monooxygenase SsuD/methylene tetrahydromethanopterin reductase-like flavin-dependent oxidoreductase (luciferase family)